MDKILEVIEKNPRLSNGVIAVMLGIPETEVAEKISLYEQTGVIKGYRAIIDKSKIETSTVSALIELKIKPQFGHGFDEVADRIANFHEVESVYLISGGYDICCVVEDKSFEEVAMFIAKRLSPLEDVVSTNTNFILKRYKQQGVVLSDKDKDDRGTISL